MFTNFNSFNNSLEQASSFSANATNQFATNDENAISNFTANGFVENPFATNPFDMPSNLESSIWCSTES